MMRFVDTEIEGVVLIEGERHEDDRGWFGRTFCREALDERGIGWDIVQSNLAYNCRKGTLRGMHWQRDPHGEKKIVQCLRGSVWDVVIDLREGSPTYGRSVAYELSAFHARAIHIPEGCAHGLQSLTDHTLVAYQMSSPYVASAACGVRWNDPAFAVEWPLTDPVLSEKDRAWPLWVERAARAA